MSAPRKRYLPVKLDNHRLDGHSLSAGCHACPQLKECGGYTRKGGGWSCMDRCSQCNKATCDVVCLKKPRDFARSLLEVGGFGFRNNAPLLSPLARLPRYVPVMQHACGRASEISPEWVAVPFTALMRSRGTEYGPRGDTPEALRNALGLAKSTRIIVLGTGKDAPIEKYWRFRSKNGVPEKLAKLGIDCAVSPNFSFFLEDPRPHHLFNRKRSIVCAEEWSAAGIATVQFMQAVTSADWIFWRRFLEAHPEVNVIGEEFQTGFANPARGRWAIDELTKLQDTLRRPLHIVAVAGARYAELLRERFGNNWTVLDSVPFMRAIKRRGAADFDRRITWERSVGENPADLFLRNSRVYSQWLGESSARKLKSDGRHAERRGIRNRARGARMEAPSPQQGAFAGWM